MSLQRDLEKAINENPFDSNLIEVYRRDFLAEKGEHPSEELFFPVKLAILHMIRRIHIELANLFSLDTRKYIRRDNSIFEYYFEDHHPGFSHHVLFANRPKSAQPVYFASELSTRKNHLDELEQPETLYGGTCKNEFYKDNIYVLLTMQKDDNLSISSSGDVEQLLELFGLLYALREQILQIVRVPRTDGLRRKKK